jgi:hypothetical protein
MSRSIANKILDTSLKLECKISVHDTLYMISPVFGLQIASLLMTVSKNHFLQSDSKQLKLAAENTFIVVAKLMNWLSVC